MEKTAVRIDEDFRKMLPQLAAEELAELEASILSEGIREPLVVWRETGILIDGHNRLKIAEKHDLPYQTQELAFADREAVRDWIINNQLGRRNLTPEAFALLLGMKYNREKQQGKRTDLTSAQSGQKSKETSERIAEEHKVSKNTVRRAGKFAEDLEAVEEVAGPEVREAVLRREKPIRRTDVARLAKVAQKDPERAKKAIDAVMQGEKPATVTTRLHREEAQAEAVRESKEAETPARIAQADSVAWLAEQGPCDLLLTDPPYSTDVADVESFAEWWLPKALTHVKPDGRAYVCIGAYPRELEAYLRVGNAHESMMLEQVLVWTYRNTLGPSPTHKYKLNWQAILYFRGMDAPRLNCPLMTEQFAVQDINAPDGRQGDRYHTWQKPDELAERIIRHSTTKGATVLDPFAGTGTFILAAARLGRIGLGCDNDSDMIATALERGCAAW